MSRLHRLGIALVVVLVAALAPASAVTASEPDRFPETNALPDGFMPEGITIGQHRTAFFGSRADGDIYAVDLRTGEGEVISQGPGAGNPSVGLKVDDDGLLFVSGGNTAVARIVDSDDGALLASLQLTTAPTFVNDVLLTQDMAWFTDSQKAVLFGVPRPDGDELPTAADVVALPLGGDWVQLTGTNANGISDTPDGEALLVINSGAGLLYRVDPDSGAATVVDLGGASLANGDGLLRHGRTLYVVRNRLNQIAVVTLEQDGTSGELTRTITSPGFDVPTTVGRLGDRLYLPNARFTTPATPTTPYSVTQVSARCSR
jgi:sugar lactone lactonase YvrE